MIRRGIPTLLVLCVAAVCLSDGVHAQSPPPGPSAQPTPPPRPIDAGVADVNPLSASLRDTRVDLRQPVGFENVYRVPGRGDLLMRSSGAITAVFPQSAYVQTSGGPFPVIPAGTVFYIGDPRQAKLAAPPSDEILQPGEVSNRVQTRRNSFMGSVNDPYIDTYAADRLPIDRRPKNGNTGPEHVDRVVPDMSEAGTPTIANNDAFRAQRIAELMAQAASATRSQPQAVLDQ